MRISWIEPDLLAASAMPYSPYDFQWLAQQGIRGIVNLTEIPSTAHEAVTDDFLNKLGLRVLHLPIVDMHAPDDLSYVTRLTEFVDELNAQRQAALIHCEAGVGRTGTMLHAYYLQQGMSLAQVKKLIWQRRNQSQFDNLKNVQKAFLENLADQLRRHQVDS